LKKRKNTRPKKAVPESSYAAETIKMNIGSEVNVKQSINVNDFVK